MGTIKRLLCAIKCICLCAILVFTLFGCGQSVKYRTAEPGGTVSPTNYTYDVGEEWETGADAGSYFPAGFVKNASPVFLLAMEGKLTYGDYSTSMSLSSIDDQYDFLMHLFFVNSHGSYAVTYTNLKKGTIGGYACIIADTQGSATSSDTVGKQVAFFTSESTYGYVNYYYNPESSSYKAQLDYALNSVKLSDGSTFVFGNEKIDAIQDDGDTTELDNLLARATTLKEEDYTPATWKIFSSDLSTAQKMRNNATAAQTDYSRVSWYLKQSMNHLAVQPKASDYSAVDYDTLARTPDTYKGTKVMISGKVIQVSEGSSETDLRVATSGSYDNVVMVGYDPSIMTSRILENDVITVYGESVGIYTYTSVSGSSVSVPGIYADMISIQ